MSDTTYYTSKCGLKCVFIRREGFVSKYAGIGTSFGGAYQKFYKDGVYYELKTGVAHFLEHKNFTMPDGKDCLELFSLMNTESNAYTSSEQTMYYCQTNDDLEESLRLLLKMYFTKGFTKENIESEKSIILSELESIYDEVDSRIEDICLKTLYPNDSISLEILGTKEDILSMNYEDLDLAYSSFYTPKNSLLVLVADMEPNQIIPILEDELAKFSFKEQEIIFLPTVESKKPEKAKVIYEDIPYPEVHILGRMDSLNYKTPILTNILLSIFDTLFSVEAPFYKELMEKNLLLSDDIETIVSTHQFGSYFHLYTYTNSPEELRDLILNKIKSLKEEEFLYPIAKSSIKCYICDHIRALDSIWYVGEDTLSLGLEGNSYEEETELFMNLKEEDFKKYIPYIRDAMLTDIIVFPKNVKK